MPARPNPKLPIVEDDAAFGMIMAAYLDAAGFETTFVKQGRDAFDRLDRENHDGVKRPRRERTFVGSRHDNRPVLNACSPLDPTSELGFPVSLGNVLNIAGLLLRRRRWGKPPS